MQSIIKHMRDFGIGTLMVTALIFTLTVSVYGQVTTVVDQDGMTIVTVHTERSEAPAANAIDGDSSTMWHTDWSAADGKTLPHYLVVDLGQIYDIGKVAVLPRQYDGYNGEIARYEIYVAETLSDSVEAKDLSQYNKVAVGEWDDSTRDEQTATFNTVSARYIYLNMVDTVNSHGSIAEFNVYLSTGENVDLAAVSTAMASVESMTGDSMIMANLYAEGQNILEDSYVTQEAVETYVLEVETTVAALSELIDAVNRAASYGETDGLNHNYLRRLAEKGQSYLETGDATTDEITDILDEINGCFNVMTDLDTAVTQAKNLVDGNEGDARYIYLLELIEKAEENHGYGLPSGTLELVIEDINTALANLENPVTYDNITPGEFWIDNNGSVISAQGGNISKVGNTYYWYGEDNRLSYSLRTGVSCYSSTDLMNWQYEGIALSVFDMPEDFYTDDLLGTQGRIERPKVIYNETTHQYVMWMHLEKYGGYGLAAAGVAVSDSPTGPFEFIHYGRPVIDTTLDIGNQEVTVSNQTYRDMNLFIDYGKDVNGDGVDDAYTIYSSEENNTLYIVRLNSDYTWVDISEEDMADAPYFTVDYQDFPVPESMQMPALTDKQLYAYVEGSTEVIVHQDGVWTRHHRDNQREAPAPFKYADRYYIITSAATGWNANQANYYMSSSILGPYTNMGDPCVGDSAGTTFTSQSTAVVTVDLEKGKFMYMGDRWKNGDYSNGDVKNSPYVWLPVEVNEDGKIAIRWYDQWTLDTLGKTLSAFEELSFILGEDEIVLPEEAVLVETATGDEYTYSVTWDEDDSFYTTPGIYTVEGVIPDLGDLAVSVDVWIMSLDTVYFVNSNATLDDGDTDYERWFAQMAQNALLQSVADQSYNEDATGYSWGYYNPVGGFSRDEATPFGTGYYRADTAAPGEEDNGFGYKFEVPEGSYDVIVGYCVPSNWNSRTINLEVQGDSTTVALSSGIETMTVVRNVAVTDDDYDTKGILDVYLRKVSADGSNYTDPIMNWIIVVPHVDYNPEVMNLAVTADLDESYYDTEEENLHLELTIEKLTNILPATAEMVVQIVDRDNTVVRQSAKNINCYDDETVTIDLIAEGFDQRRSTVEVYLVSDYEADEAGFDLLAEPITVTLRKLHEGSGRP